MLDHRTRQLSTASIPEKFEISDYCWNNLDLYFLLKNDEEGRYSIKQWDTSAKGYADGLYELTNWEGERGKDFSILRIFNEELYLGTKQGALFTFWFFKYIINIIKYYSLLLLTPCFLLLSLIFFIFNKNGAQQNEKNSQKPFHSYLLKSIQACAADLRAEH